MSKLLVPYDGSAGAQRALRFAAERHPDTEIVALYVVEVGAVAGGYPDTVTDYFENVMQNAQELVDEATAAYDHVTGEVTAGRPVSAILSTVDEEGFDAVVMGSRGEGGIPRALLGSVAEAVVRRSSVPTTVVKSEPVIHPDRILVPFDGSEPAEAALDHALAVFDCDITVLYVAYPSQTLAQRLFTRPEGTLTEWETERDDRTKAVHDSALTIAGRHDRTITTEYVEGEPTAEILDYIEDHDYEHIVIGNRGRSGIKRLLLGSVAEGVVRRSPTSVTVVR